MTGAETVSVRFDADHEGYLAVVRWSCADHDLAILVIEPNVADEAVPAARFAGVGDKDAVLTVRAVGFPWFKLRTDPDKRYRDTLQADGTVAVLSNRREGTLEFTVNASPAARAEPGSPWEGMSGAPLWYGDRIIGVLTKHHPSDGLGRLAATRVDRCVATLENRERLDLTELVGPTVSGSLPDVLAPIKSDSYGAHQAAVREVCAPLGGLLDREQELAELVEFCAGDQPYLWWQAAPWAGKTALMYWFAHHPPEGVDVLSYFITRRIPGESDSRGFLKAMAQQLSHVTDEDTKDMTAAELRRNLHGWLDTAASRAHESGRVLLLIIDGLDEDTDPHGELGSITSLLPGCLPDNMRVVVSSRPHPQLRKRVRANHPLESCPVRELSPSPHAKRLEVEASNELGQVLHKAGVERDVLALIAASGGGLARPDLEHLTGAAPIEINDLMEGSLSRSLASRLEPTGQATYFFSHDTLRATTEQSLRNTEIDDRRAKLHDWADAWRERGWPEKSPDYLLRDYPYLLQATQDIRRLARCATDRRRHERMRARTGNDYLALAEVSLAHDLNVRQEIPDLPLALRLALRRDELARRYEDMPACLPAAWELLGQHTHAEGLANSTDEQTRLWALSDLAETIASNGDRPRAETIARLIKHSAQQTETLAWIAELAGDHDQAMDIALSAEWSGELLTSLAVAAESRGDHGRVHELASHCHDVYLNGREGGLYQRCAVAAAGRRNYERARALVRSISGEDATAAQAEALIDVATAAAAEGDEDHAGSFRTDASRLSREIEDNGDRHHLLARLAAFDGKWECAEKHERAVDEADGIAEFDWLVACAAKAGDYDDARAIADAHPSGTSPEPWGRVESVMAMAANRHYERAARLARSLPPSAAARALAEAGRTAAKSGDHDEARRLLIACEEAMHAEADPAHQATSVIAALRVIGASGTDDDQIRAQSLICLAEEKVRRITDPGRRDAVLDRLVSAVAAAGHCEWAQTILESLASPVGRARGLCALAEDAARAGDHTRARRLRGMAAPIMYSAPRSRGHDKALAHLVCSAILTADLDEAHRALAAIEDDFYKYDPIQRLAEMEPGSIDHHELVRLAHTIDSPCSKGMAFASLAAAAYCRGDAEQARLLLYTAEGSASVCLERLRRIVDYVDRISPNVECKMLLEKLLQTATQIGEEDLARSFVDEAIALAAAEENGLTRSSAIRELLMPAAKVCDHDEITSMISSALEAPVGWGQADQDREIALLASEVARLGEYALAEELTACVKSASKRAGALAQLATALAADRKTGDAHRLFAQADAAIGAATHPASENLKALAIAANSIGEHDRADAFAFAVFRSHMRAQALIELAEADLRLRDRTTDPLLHDLCTGRAARRAAEALALEVWTEIRLEFQDGSGPLSFAMKLDRRCADVLLELRLDPYTNTSH